MSTTMNVTVKNIVKTTAEWASSPVSTTAIPNGVICVEIDTNNKSWIKIGNGSSTYSQLPYITDGAIASLGQFMRLKGIVATVSDLPDGTTGHERAVGDVYLVGTASASGKNDFEEYVFVENGTSGGSGDWEKLGSLDVTVPVYGASSSGGLRMDENQTSHVQEFSITNTATGTNTSGTGTTSGAASTTSFGGTVQIPYITYDGHGLITNGTGTRSFTLPDSAFTGAGQSTAGTKGLVPAPTSGTTNAYLKSDGTWATPNTTLSNDSNLVTSGAVYAVVGNINTVLESVL